MIAQHNSRITMADKLSESESESMLLHPILEQIGLLFNDHFHTENI